MNILFVTGLFATRVDDTSLGGMARAVYKSAKGMKERGHQVRVLAVDNRDRKWNYKEIPVISIDASVNPDEEDVICLLENTVSRERKIQKAINKLNQEWKIDIIQYTGWFGIGLFHYSKIPAVMRISSNTKVQLNSIYSIAKEKCLDKLEYMAIMRMNAVFAPSNVMACSVTQNTGRKVRVIETPYDNEEIVFDDSVYNKKLNNKKYILFFGRMSKDKGIYVIRDILYRVLKKYPEIHFVFAGDLTINEGISVEEQLKDAAMEFSSRIIFLGKLPAEKLFPAIEGAEMILMPSLMDNFPNACAEAMSLGKIVIGTDGSSLDQFISNGYNGLLAKIGDADSLLTKIKEVINMSDEQKCIMSVNAKKRIKELSLDNYSRKMEKYYKKIITACNNKKR